MKLKYLLPFIVSMIFFSFARLYPKGQELVVLKQQLPYEITNVTVSFSTLTIEGWAFINSNQHFLDSSTHSTTVEFTSREHRFKIPATLQPKDMISLMWYRGVRICGTHEYKKTSSTCNYSYKNVGFKVTVPLDTFNKNQTYTAMLILHAKQTDTKYKIQLFYPMKQPITKQSGDYQFEVHSALKDTRLIVNHENVVVRSGPSTAYPIVGAGASCSSAYANKLFYEKGQVFSNIIDKTMVNGVSVYRLKGNVLGCIKLKQRVKEGYSIDPMYIASTFVEYSGIMMSIENKLINEAPVLYVEHPTIHVDESFNWLEYVSAYDLEEKDLTKKIRVVSNSFMNKVGQYQIVLFVEDKHGYSDQKTMNVIVVGPKNTAPRLIVHDRTIKQFSYFDALEGAQAYDKEDGNLSSQIQLVNTVSTNKIGQFNQCYQVCDSANATATQCAVITIMERNETVNHRFIHAGITSIDHNSWNTSLREIKNQLQNDIPILRGEMH